MRSFLKYIFNFVFFFFSLQWASAQRPKIGLTLSGGGAKGLAHIGILKALDSAGLKIDYITGTSMGAVVGGLYAAGYSGDEIEKLAKDINWKTIFSNSVQMRSFIMEEKSEYGKYALELPLKNNRLKLPTGVIESQELWLKLNELFYPVLDVRNFDSLSIPFRCIGTDLETGDAYIFKSGSIASAVRASMAIPGVFSTVERDGKYFVDGGVIRNFPVRDVKDMGADFVIGVSVSQPLDSAKKLDNAFKILTQIVFLGEKRDREAENPLCNILVEIPTNEYSSRSFGNANEIINLGIETGRQFYPRFKQLADSLQQLYGAARFEKNRLSSVGKLRFDSVKVVGLTKNVEKAFKEQLSFDAMRKYSSAEIATAVRNAFGTRMYKNLVYDIDPGKSSADTTGQLIFNITPQPATMVKGAINYNSFTRFSAIANITARNWLLPFSRSMLAVDLGDNSRFLGEQLMMFGRKKALSYRLQGYVELQDLQQYASFISTGLYKYHYYEVDNQVLLSGKRKWSGGLGTRWERIRMKPQIISGKYADGDNSFFSTYATASFNNFDKPFYPTAGWKMNGELGYVFGVAAKLNFYNNGTYLGDINSQPINYGNYARFNGNIDGVIPLSRRMQLLAHAQSIINFGRDNSLFNFVVAGGMNELMHNQVMFAGFNPGEITSQSMAVLQPGLRYRFGSDYYTTLKLNTMVYNFIPKDFENLRTNYISGAGLTFGYDMPLIGPLDWTLMYSDKGGGFSTYISVGFTFGR
jgi:NTE family protein